VRQRIEFKMAVLVYKALNGLSPQYLADDCQLITTTGRRRLSSNVANCDVPRTRTTLSDRSFTAACPHLWNNLPFHLRDFELSLSEFRQLLKTHLFGWNRGAWWPTFRCNALYKCTYLLTYLHDNDAEICIKSTINQKRSSCQTYAELGQLVNTKIVKKM